MNSDIKGGEFMTATLEKASTNDALNSGADRRTGPDGTARVPAYLMPEGIEQPSKKRQRELETKNEEGQNQKEKLLQAREDAKARAEQILTKLLRTEEGKQAVKLVFQYILYLFAVIGISNSVDKIEAQISGFEAMIRDVADRNNIDLEDRSGHTTDQSIPAIEGANPTTSMLNVRDLPVSTLSEVKTVEEAK